MADDLPGGVAPEDVSILVVDDDEGHAEAMAESLARVGYRTDVAPGGREGLQRLDERAYDIVLTDLKMSGVGGIEILEAARRRRPDCAVIVITGQATVETAVEALQKGAANYLSKPLDVRMVREVVRRQAESQRLVRSHEELRRRLDQRYGFGEIIGHSRAMTSIFAVIEQIADTDATVLITGESGTGKELIARALHENSRRRNQPFVAVSCAALGEGVLESELFGHEKGAFTGAHRARKGRFEAANHGTLFLDEVGDMPLPIQVKLLRVIEQRQVERVGSNESIDVDVRLIAATNQDLEIEVREKRFREDLYFRLKVVPIRLPPLRERRDDIPLLCDAFLKELAATHGKPARELSPAARRVLGSHSWPGNVRELRNVIETMVVVSRGEVLDVRDLPFELRESDGAPSTPTAPMAGMTIEQMERHLIRDTLAAVDGNRAKAAEMLGISERTLYRKIKAYGL